MGKTNWTRVFLGGLVAGVVLNILLFVTLPIYLRELWNPILEALNPTFKETFWLQFFGFVFYFITGIISVWLYSAIRPKYGPGVRTALIAGISIGILCALLPAISFGLLGIFPVKVLVIDSLTAFVTRIVATLAGAWVYKE